MQIDTMILMGMVKHSQSSQNSKFKCMDHYLVLPFIHCYLPFVAFSDKIYAPVSFKIVLKVC